MTLPKPVARSHPGVAPKEGWYALVAVVGLITAMQLAPVPPPPEIVQMGTAVYPEPPLVKVTELTTFVVALMVAVHLAVVPPE